MILATCVNKQPSAERPSAMSSFAIANNRSVLSFQSVCQSRSVHTGTEGHDHLSIRSKPSLCVTSAFDSSWRWKLEVRLLVHVPYQPVRIIRKAVAAACDHHVLFMQSESWRHETTVAVASLTRHEAPPQCGNNSTFSARLCRRGLCTALQE